MKVIEYEPEKGTIVLVPTSPEDLLVLFEFLDVGDLLSGKTHRVVKFEEGEKDKLQIHVTIEVKEKFLDFQSRSLKITGRIVEGPEEIEGIKGRFQTISILINNSYKIIKNRDGLKWALFFKFIKKNNEKLVIIAVDTNEATLAIVHGMGEMELHSFSYSIKEKSFMEEHAFLSELLNNLEDRFLKLLETTEAPIVIAGPGFVKDEFFKRLSLYPKIKEKIIALVSSTSGSVAGIYEVLKNDEVEFALGKFEAYKEARAMETLLKQLGTNPSLVSFDIQQIKDLSERGAVSTLLILDNVSSIVKPEMYGIITEILVSVERHSGKVILVNSKTEAGKKLRALGGIAALLRYNI